MRYGYSYWLSMWNLTCGNGLTTTLVSRRTWHLHILCKLWGGQHIKTWGPTNIICYHLLIWLNMFKYNGERWFIPSPSHPPKLNYTHFTGNMFYDFTMCLAGHGFERWCSTWSTITSHRIPCYYMINVSIHFRCVSKDWQEMPALSMSMSCLEAEAARLSSRYQPSAMQNGAWEWQIRQSALHQDIPFGNLT